MRTTLKSKQVEIEDIDTGPFFNMSIDTASTDSTVTKAGNLDDITIAFNYRDSKFSLLCHLDAILQ